MELDNVTGEDTYAALMSEYGWLPDQIDTMHPYWILVALGHRVDHGTPVLTTQQRLRAKLQERKRQRDQQRTGNPKPPPRKPQ